MTKIHWKKLVVSHRKALLFGLFLTLGSGIVLNNTPWRIGVVDDSVFYLSSAENFLSGEGFSWPIGGDELKPLTHYPPFFPLTLAFLGWLGLDMVSAARILIALLFGANVALIGYAVHRFTESWRAGLTASSLALLSPIMIDAHLLALTEPLMLFLLLLALIFLVDHLREGGKKALLFAGILTGLICITRYAGLAFLGAGAVALVVLGRGVRRQRYSNAISFTILGAIPLIVWYIRNVFLTGSVANREFLYHRLTDVKIKQLASSISVWLFSENAAFDIRFFSTVGLALSLSVLIVWFFNREKRGGNWITTFRSESWRPVIILLIYALIYSIFLFFSLSFVDASTRLDNRILAPLYLILFLLVFIFLGKLLASTHRLEFFSLLLAGSWVLIFASYAVRSADILNHMAEDGQGFTGRAWQEMEILKRINDLPEEFLLYSTEALPLYFITGRPAYWVPEKINPLTSREVEDYQVGLDIMRNRLEKPSSALVILTEWGEYLHAPTRTELPPMEEVIDGLIRLAKFSDGAVYIDPDNLEELRYLRERWK
jgi:hypothetical protein